ncbi:MAG: hypothetical protein JSW71_13035 [Gemmatimonadota bacterium]|nr:MAG: hypothetical protein JSW71_13035 [Gemmatimonadota bacterium]
MNRAGLWSEILAPAGALLVAMTASTLRMPVLLAALTLLWFSPALLRHYSLVAPLDERETAVYRLAQRVSLSVLLVLVTVLPYLLVSARDDTSHPLQSEWLDVGFLVVAIFYLRTAVVLHRTVPRTVAAHLAGAGATLVTIIGFAGAALQFPERIPIWARFAPLLCFLPHVAALKWRRLASVLWLGGAILTAFWTLTTITSRLEQVISFGILVLPWTLAAYWIASGEH